MRLLTYYINFFSLFMRLLLLFLHYDTTLYFETSMEVFIYFVLIIHSLKNKL